MENEEKIEMGQQSEGKPVGAVSDAHRPAGEGSDSAVRKNNRRRRRGGGHHRRNYNPSGDRMEQKDSLPSGTSDWEEDEEEVDAESDMPETAGDTEEFFPAEDAASVPASEQELPAEETPNEPKPETETPGEPVPTVEVVGVHFKKSGKMYYFDPCGLTIERDAHVIVETARGLEYGYVSAENRMVPERDIVPPLKKVLRIATEADEKHYEQNLQKEIGAFNTCLLKIEEHRLEMKLIEAEYTFDNSKLLFYYTADGRVDFRELARDLATVFRTRIELRQIGIRDEAKMLGGLGICGRPFCCKSFLPDFVQVSIKMAKEQNLSLNSAKISGACGRLMCCLRYEYDTYVEEAALTPKIDAIVSTPEGDGIVVENSPLAGLVKVVMKSAPDDPPRLYHRDDVKVKGYAKKGERGQNQNAPKEEEDSPVPEE